MSNIIDSIRLSGVTYTIQDSGGIPESTFTAYTAATDARIAEDEEVTAAALNELNEAISGVSGNNVVELTQAQYDILVTGGTVDPNTFYIITDATAGDLTQYWTSAQTQSAITSAVSTKQDTLVSGTNIKTINNESLLGSGNIDIQGGGGTTYTAGRGIDITNDTISVSLPISAGTGVDSVLLGYTNSSSSWMPKATSKGAIAAGAGVSAMSECSFAFGYKSKTTGGTTKKYNFAHGYNTIANGAQSHAEGTDTISNGANSHADGKGTIANNDAEHASGQYNVSNSATTTFGDSGNTLFSVGNGTSTNARHNAFEIRQNGDIYLTKDGQDVKLQDQLGGGSITVDTALDSGSTNPVENRVIYNKIDEVEEVTAAGLNAVNSALGGLKLQQITQSAYDALVTKDASTLYIIVN